MDEFFAEVQSISTLVFAVSSMLTVGFSYTLREIVRPLRNARLVIAVLVANFVMVPLLAYLITSVFSFDKQQEAGLLVVACAAGAPFLIKLVQLAKSDLAIASGFLVLLLICTMIYMPVVLPRLVPDADVNALDIAQPLLLNMLLPLIAGLVLDWWHDRIGDRLLPILGVLTNIAIVSILVATFITNWDILKDVFGTGLITAAILFIAGAFVIGWVIGMPFGSTRDEVALATAQRNIAAATVVATQSIGHPDTIVTVVVTSMGAMVVLFPIAAFLGKRAELTGVTAPGPL